MVKEQNIFVAKINSSAKTLLSSNATFAEFFADKPMFVCIMLLLFLIVKINYCAI